MQNERERKGTKKCFISLHLSEILIYGTLKLEQSGNGIINQKKKKMSKKGRKLHTYQQRQFLCVKQRKMAREGKADRTKEKNEE